MGFGAMPAYAVVTQEPASSVMASGNWVKIRVTEDAIYQLTYDKLKSLGFAEPEKVKVFGYAPTVLLTHDSSLIPADLSPVYTLHADKQRKLLFYGKGDTDFAPELWNHVKEVNSYLHKKHAHSIGATYFLSDADVEAAGIATMSAPQSVTDGAVVLDTHTSLIYHEDDAVNYSHGGFWFGGPAINSSRTSETHDFTVSKVAPGEATMVYKSLLSNKSDSKSNYLSAEYSDGITASESTGSSPGAMASYQEFSQSIRFQPLTLPAKAEPATYSVTFSVNPDASEMSGNCALDFYGLLYKRTNDLAGDAQVHMYFENWESSAYFSLSGMQQGNWQVWNVTDPAAPARFELTAGGDSFIGSLDKAQSYIPNEVIAFDLSAVQPEPEVVGVLENQDLHGLPTPDLVILTSKMFMPSAEKVADFHRRYQGIDVAVVDQQKVFNEFASGNTSPEGVRRFLRYLDRKTPEKLKALLLLGPGTFENAKLVNDGQPYVITAEAEEYSVCPYVTKNYCADTFFGRFGEKQTFDSWIVRGDQLQIFANDMDIAVGRLPFLSNAEIDNYYKKAEVYMTARQRYPGIGNVILASDYSSAKEEHHLSNAEALVDDIGENAGKTVTVTRAASNLISSANNVIVKKIMNNALNNGASFFVYFGHGNANNIAGSTSTTDFFFDLQSAERLSTPGRYPFMFIGSCNVAEFDISPQTLTNVFLANPNGGAIGVVAAGREVFQPQNQALGETLTSELMAAADGEWYGAIWARTQSKAISKKYLSKDNIANHLDYNLLGDPAMPYYGATHAVELDGIADNTINILGDNVVTGTVNNLDGSIDESFSGIVMLTLYDVPLTRQNVLGTNASSSHTYYASVELDQEILTQVTGKVENGRFRVNFVGPTSTRSGTHRIQAYAYSDDATKRGLGYLADVSMAYDEANVVTPTGGPVEITSFTAGSGSDGSMLGEKVTLSATVHAPAGLAPQSGLINPVRLTVDGLTACNLHRLINYEDPATFNLEYVTGQLAGGKHKATLSVLDAAGNWAEESVEFIVDNAPAATISAAVDGSDVNIEVYSSIAALAAKRLIVERLNGDIVADKEMQGNTFGLTLEPGAYRAYVQLRTESAASATPRIEIIVD